MIIANKKAFTLIELIIAIALIGVAIVGILRLLQEWLRFVDRTRQDVVAINLARQWVEAMFTIRNTNWRTWAGKKESCRLLTDTFSNYPSLDCENRDWMWSWFYVLNDGLRENQHYFILSGASSRLLDLTDWLQSDEEQYALCQSWLWRETCPWQVWTGSEWQFYRQVVGLWLYRKDVNTPWWDFIQCDNGSAVDQSSRPCWDWPKEYRFCVRVASFKQWAHLVEQCSVMTNFY